MTHYSEIYNPDQQRELRISDTTMFVDPEIRRVTEKFNATPYDKLCQKASDSLIEFGSEDSAVTCGRFGEYGYSESEAVVYWTPFSNGLNQVGNRPNLNMYLRSYYLMNVMKELDITDERGDYKPLIVVAAPSGPDGLVLDRNQRADKAARKSLGKNGHLSIGVEKQLEVVKMFSKFGKIACTGASLGGSEAVTAAAISDFDVTHVVACDPANVEERSTLSLGLSFLSQGKYLESAVSEAGIDAFNQVLSDGSISDLAKNVFAQRKINWAIWRALAKNTLGDELIETLKRGIPTTIAYGTDNAVVPQDAIEECITMAEGYVSATNRKFPAIHRLIFENGRHVWMDNLEKHAIAMGYGLTRAA